MRVIATQSKEIIAAFLVVICYLLLPGKIEARAEEDARMTTTISLNGRSCLSFYYETTRRSIYRGRKLLFQPSDHRGSDGHGGFGGFGSFTTVESSLEVTLDGTAVYRASGENTWRLFVSHLRGTGKKMVRLSYRLFSDIGQVDHSKQQII